MPAAAPTAPRRLPDEGRARHAFRCLVALVERTVRDSIRDRLTGMAAEVAFFMVFSLPPLLLALLGAVGYLAESLGPGVTGEIHRELIAWCNVVLSHQTVEKVVEPLLRQLLTRGRADIASVGIVLSLWSASRATRVIIDTVTIAYDQKESRPIWQRIALAVGMTTTVIIIGTLLLPLLVLGPSFGATIASEFGVGHVWEVVWRWSYWPTVGLLGIISLTTLYTWAPPVRTPWTRDVPGALVAFMVWLGGSGVLRFYARTVFLKSAAYGAVSAPMAVLLFVYITAAAVLVGAELNAEIEKMWPSHAEGAAHQRSRVKRVRRRRKGNLQKYRMWRIRKRRGIGVFRPKSKHVGDTDEALRTTTSGRSQLSMTSPPSARSAKA